MTDEMMFVTTPIFYPNDIPHLGTAYPVLAADILARWARLKGLPTFFLTGTDEHGKKIELAAHKSGMQPKQFVDELSDKFVENFKLLNVSFDRFIRTTDPDHMEIVSYVLQKVYDKGDIYKGHYHGLYCIDCESYYIEEDLKSGNCPVHYKPVEDLKEESYFFKLSKYQPWLLEFYNQHSDFVIPRSRFKEIKSFVKRGLEDLCISRSSFRWGIPLPFDHNHITYVWFDALINYITGAKYTKDDAHFQKTWSHAIHIIGKDILRFHAAIWPCMLHSAGLEQPRKIVAHGFWTVNGRKFSKSLGNVVHLDYLINTYGRDTLRYYMFKESRFSHDGDFSEYQMVLSNNKDLAQGLGNLLNRFMVMVEKYCSGCIPTADFFSDDEHRIRKLAHTSLEEMNQALDEIDFKKALESIWKFVRQMNGYINDSEPWNLFKTGHIPKLHAFLATLAEGLKFLAVQIAPFIPDTAENMVRQIGLSSIPSVDRLMWDYSLSGKNIGKKKLLFQVLDLPEKVAPAYIKHHATEEVLKLGISYCIAQIHWTKVKGQTAVVEKAKRAIEQEILNKDPLWYKFDPMAYGFDDLYKKIGREQGEIRSPMVSLTDYIYSSPENRLPQINTIVDAYNIFSLRHKLSIGAHDREKLHGDITLSLATQPISYLPLGSAIPMIVEPGEYYWRDEETVLCRLDIKQAEATKIDGFTQHVVLIVQGNPNVTAKYIRDKTQELCEWLVSIGGGDYEIL